MPEINRFACDRCDFQLPTGWGGYCYAVDDAGERVVCPHPGERYAIARVTGMTLGEAMDAGRTGFNSHCVCLSCLGQFDLDLQRDQRVCPRCSSEAVKSTAELVGRPCPKCKAGVVERGSPIRWKLDPDRASMPVPPVVKDMVGWEKTREVPPSLWPAFEAAERFRETLASDLYGHCPALVFYTPCVRLLGWWEGDYFGDALGTGTEPAEALEMRPEWTWCRVLPLMIDATPELRRLIRVDGLSCRFNAGVTAGERRGIKNYLREHREHRVES